QPWAYRARPDELAIGPRLHVDVVKHSGRGAGRRRRRGGVRQPGGRSDHDPGLPTHGREELTARRESRQLILRWPLLLARRNRLARDDPDDPDDPDHSTARL